MNSLRKILGLLMAVMLATFAGSSIAASGTKTFFATSKFTSATTVEVTFLNNSPPPGLSAGNSVKVVAPKNGNNLLVKITGLASGSAGSILSLTNTSTDSEIVINNFSGINRGQQKTFKLTVQVLTLDCQVATWGAKMNTGNSFNGDAFG